jgi:hypothetical protein
VARVFAPRSPRWRRRFLYVGSAAAAVSAVGLLVAVLPSGGSIPAEDTAPPRAASDWHPPHVAERRITITPALRRELDDLLTRFVRNAVAREDPEAAWNDATSALKAGSTRSDWRRGNLPVYPFPARVREATGWHLREPLENALVLDLVLHARPRTKRGAIGFQVEVRRIAKGGKARWLVNSFVPERVYPVGDTRLGPRPFARVEGVAPGIATRQLGLVWLLVPAGVLSLVFVVPLIFALVSWRKGVRAMNAYRREAAPR